jgi:hypothetical protein
VLGTTAFSRSQTAAYVLHDKSSTCIYIDFSISVSVAKSVNVSFFITHSALPTKRQALPFLLLKDHSVSFVTDQNFVVIFHTYSGEIRKAATNCSGIFRISKLIGPPYSRSFVEIQEPQLYVVPSEMVGRQNNFSSPPTLFETRGRNVTVCPANICCCDSDTFFITEMLPAYYSL